MTQQSDTSTHQDTAPQAHPFMQLFARYRAVLSAAWSQRHALDGPERNDDERAFLPAALSLQETPPHPLPRSLAWALMALFVIAMLWACIGKVDIVAVAPGRIVVSERTKLVQPLEASVVRRVLVKDGDSVKTGQVLVELDPTMAQADRNAVHEQYLLALGEALRAQALLKALDNVASSFVQAQLPNLPPEQARQVALLSSTQAFAIQQSQQLQAQWQDIRSKHAKLQAEGARKRAELETARQLLTKLETTLPLSQQRERDFETLVKHGFVANHTSQDRQRERLELELDLATQKAKVQEMQAALQESEQALLAFVAETRRALRDSEHTSTSKAAQLQAEASKAAQRQRQTELKAPIDGTVQQLAIHTAGGVVTSAQPLMVIVPETQEVTALVQVANLDIGFVREGHSAQIKLETFPYTLYGSVPATVTVLGGDAVTDEKTGVSTYPATLTLQRTSLQIEDKRIPITPGMNLSAEIKTGHRRIIDYLLSPIAKAASESLRER